MNWAFGIKQKIAAAILLGVTFLLIFFKNRMDRQHVVSLNSSFLSVYEDRLLVESYIYQLSELLHEKKEFIDNCERQGRIFDSSNVVLQNTKIRSLIVDYEKTKITREEAVAFHKLKESLNRIISLESDYILLLDKTSELPPIHNALQDEFRRSIDHLRQLSAIQLSEAKKLLVQSKKIMDGADLWSELEFAVLIILALIIQVMIFASQSIRIPDEVSQHGLN